MTKKHVPLKKIEGLSVALGIMSGTSMDGLDIALCRFENSDFNILKAKTIPYNTYWRNQLSASSALSGAALLKLDAAYAVWIAQQINRFLKPISSKNQPELIAFHGHTVFHQPEANVSYQLGSGAVLAARSKHPVVCDFRSTDIALGGQGAPLVPLGDKILFSNYPACLNIGGFANISLDFKNQRIAFDIVPVNYALNRLCELLNVRYDHNGDIAKSGILQIDLFNTLNAHAFFKLRGPKSLGREWFDTAQWPLMYNSSYTIQDRIRTYTEHSAFQIAQILKFYNIKQVCVSGGGTLNSSLLSYINKYCTCSIHVPDPKIIHFKEALIFAWLGLQRFKQKTNTLRTVTGAQKNSSGGALYLP
jgi:anhydro-N-acetylmuramic acid kinase